ncbi:hypothetical protein U4L15_23000, partial [Klebsiella pneumoniae]|nr:hypothetical protein [Klebsiella pneumoniae]
APQTPLKLISTCSHLTLNHIPSTTHLSPDKFPSPIPQYSPQPHPPPFPYIPESFSQYLFVIHPFPQLRINFINIFITLH